LFEMAGDVGLGPVIWLVYLLGVWGSNFKDFYYNLCSVPCLFSISSWLFQQLLLFWRNSPTGARAASFVRYVDHTRHTTVGRTPLYEWSARRRDLYLTTLDTQHSQETDIHAPGGIRTCNPSQRAAADPCLRPLVIVPTHAPNSKVQNL
jgi:hypothetical protein